MLSEVCRHIVVGIPSQGPVACLYSIADYSCEGKSDRRWGDLLLFRCNTTLCRFSFGL